MLLVVAIIGTLAALIVPKIAGKGEDAKESRGEGGHHHPRHGVGRL